MARKPRFILPGVPKHVVQRGHNREPCFYLEDDNNRYLDNLHEAAIKNCVAIYAYVLMTNHVHLLVTPAHMHGITHMMQDTGRNMSVTLILPISALVHYGRGVIKLV